MMKSLLAAGAVAMALLGAPLSAQNAPFGSDDDAAYAALLWNVMISSNLVGENAPLAIPTEGGPPGHGRMLGTLFSTGTVDGHTGDLIVKSNYGPEGVSADAILADPAKHLGAITVMFRRQAGYDEDNKNWFWVMFMPNGTLGKNPAGMRMAGKIAKGMDVGCIACHSQEEDRVFLTDHFN